MSDSKGVGGKSLALMQQRLLGSTSNRPGSANTTSVEEDAKSGGNDSSATNNAAGEGSSSSTGGSSISPSVTSTASATTTVKPQSKGKDFASMASRNSAVAVKGKGKDFNNMQKPAKFTPTNNNTPSSNASNKSSNPGSGSSNTSLPGSIGGISSGTTTRSKGKDISALTPPNTLQSTITSSNNNTNNSSSNTSHKGTKNQHSNSRTATPPSHITNLPVMPNAPSSVSSTSTVGTSTSQVSRAEFDLQRQNAARKAAGMPPIDAPSPLPLSLMGGIPIPSAASTMPSVSNPITNMHGNKKKTNIPATMSTNSYNNTAVNSATNKQTGMSRVGSASSLNSLGVSSMPSNYKGTSSTKMDATKKGKAKQGGTSVQMTNKGRPPNASSSETGLKKGAPKMGSTKRKANPGTATQKRKFAKTTVGMVGVVANSTKDTMINPTGAGTSSNMTSQTKISNTATKNNTNNNKNPNSTNTMPINLQRNYGPTSNTNTNHLTINTQMDNISKMSTPQPTPVESMLTLENIPLLGPKLSSLLKSINPNGMYTLDSEAEEQLLQIADDFSQNLIQKSVKIAQHRHNRKLQRNSSSNGGNLNELNQSIPRVESRDVALVLRKEWGMQIPGLDGSNAGKSLVRRTLINGGDAGGSTINAMPTNSAKQSNMMQKMSNNFDYDRQKKVSMSGGVSA
mmetsp:Transcript_3534/g.4917  ORF Transcript_3534/g.4917 Transcript_3534/m.4917 type:complete len:681 (-) Transcript_3534:108-2150(-)